MIFLVVSFTVNLTSLSEAALLGLWLVQLSEGTPTRTSEGEPDTEAKHSSCSKLMWGKHLKAITLPRCTCRLTETVVIHTRDIWPDAQGRQQNWVFMLDEPSTNLGWSCSARCLGEALQVLQLSTRQASWEPSSSAWLHSGPSNYHAKSLDKRYEHRLSICRRPEKFHTSSSSPAKVLTSNLTARTPAMCVKSLSAFKGRQFQLLWMGQVKSGKWSTCQA